jgi:AcrR family transcriptional regulator
MSKAPTLPVTNAEVPDARLSKRDARRRAFLDAAMDLFVTVGYAATSLHDVVSRSGGSLATLYDIFGNKAGLFRELVEEKCNAASGMFDDAAVANMPPQEALTRLAYRLYALITSPEARTGLRLILSEGGQELAETFFRAGPDTGKARVAKYLAEQARRGVLDIEDPALAAQQFCGLICAGQEIRIAAGLPPVIEPERVGDHIRTAVRTFIRGHAPEKKR